MAEEQDKESKTEEASPKRVEDALKKGNTPFSREVSAAATILAIGLAAPASAYYISSRSSAGLGLFLDKPGEFRLESPEDAVGLIFYAGFLAISCIWPLLLGLLAIGLASSALQNPPRLVAHRIAPDFSRISISKGWQRIVGVAGQVEFLKSVIKVAVFCVILNLAIRGAPERLLNSLLAMPSDLQRIIADEVAGVFVTMGLCIAALAGADLLWTRFKWQTDLRMSKQELKDEHKQAEGDPLVRAQQRSIARSRARKRMIASVKNATLVVVNPTHYAVALRYVHGEAGVPVVLAKGIDSLALKIREMAEASDIPVVEDRALARSLYEAVKTDRPIPAEFYRAVAEIILFLMSQRGAHLPKQ
jgi:flagellar biosynthetic protein FlhB